MQNLTIEFNHTGVVQVRGDIEDTAFLNHLASAISALDRAIAALNYKPPIERKQLQRSQRKMPTEEGRSADDFLKYPK